MTLAQIKTTGARFALNEITGQMLELFGNGKEDKNLIPGDSGSPKTLLSLLFDAGHIENNWSPLSNCEAESRYRKLTGNTYRASAIGGCIACQRL